MIEIKLFNKIKTNLIYKKNNLIFRYKTIQKKRKAGKKIPFSIFLREMGLIKPSKPHSHLDFRKKQQLNKKDTKAKLDYKSILTVMSSCGFIIISFGISQLFFEKSNEINFFKLNTENESKILNILKSPKTNVYLNNYYNNDNNNVDYYFLIVDKLDSYSYKIHYENENINEELKSTLLQQNYNSTHNISSFDKSNIESIVEFENTYLINNKHNIPKNYFSEKDIHEIENIVKEKTFLGYKKSKRIIIASLTILLSSIFHILYFYTKKVISKK